MALQPQQQFINAAAFRQRFDRQFNRAAARQAETVRIVGGNAVADDFGYVAADAVVAHAGDQVIFNAAARDRADHRAIFANGQRGADGARAGTPGLDDGDQLTAAPGRDPRGAGFQYFEVDRVHEWNIL